MWLSGVERIPGNSAGSMAGGGQKKILLHTTEGSSIDGAVGAYQQNNSWPTLTVDCPRRRVVEHLDLTVSARSLRNLSGGVETNRQGSILVQIEMVGFAQNPATIGSTADLAWFHDNVIAPIASLTGVPLTSTVKWVAYPASYGQSAAQRLSNNAWSGYSGLLGHQHAPENDHGDPGAIDIATILSAPQGGDMPLTDDDVNKIVSALNPFIEKAADDAAKQQANFLCGSTNGLFNPNLKGNEWMATAIQLPDVKIDAHALAEELAPLLPPGNSIDPVALEEALTTALGDVLPLVRVSVADPGAR